MSQLLKQVDLTLKKIKPYISIWKNPKIKKVKVKARPNRITHEFSIKIKNKIFRFNSTKELGEYLGDLRPRLSFNELENILSYQFERSWDNEFKFDKLMERNVLGGFFNRVGEHKTAVKKDYYPSIRYDLNGFFENDYIKHNFGTFLDIGSCNGEKLAAARLMGYNECLGIEISAESCDVAKSIFRNDDSFKIYNKDAFNAGAIIEKANLIYTYVPISNHYKMLKLYFHIARNMRVGAVHVEVAGDYTDVVMRIFGIKGNLTRPAVTRKLNNNEIQFNVDVRDGINYKTETKTCKIPSPKETIALIKKHNTINNKW